MSDDRHFYPTPRPPSLADSAVNEQPRNRREIKVLHLDQNEDRVFAHVEMAGIDEVITFHRWPGTKTVCYYPGWDELSGAQQRQIAEEIWQAIERYRGEHRSDPD